jgi:hypothetical protein
MSLEVMYNEPRPSVAMLLAYIDASEAGTTVGSSWLLCLHEPATKETKPNVDTISYDQDLFEEKERG